MFSRASLVLSTAAVVALVGCSSQDSEPVRNDAPTTPTQEAPSLDSVEQARELYKEVLSNPKDIEFNYPHEDRGPDTGTPGPKSGFQYAIVEATGDDVPELLVRRGSWEINPVAVFTTDGEELVAIEDVLVDGAASRGGARAGVLAKESGDGFFQTEGQSMSPQHEATEFRIDGTRLVAGPSLSFEAANPSSLPSAQPIEWTDSDDLSVVDALGSSADEDVVAAGPSPTLPVGVAPGSSDSETGPETDTGMSAASALERCVYRKGHVSAEGNPADVPSTVTGTVHKADAGQLAGDEPGMVPPDYASREEWFLALESPITLSGVKSGTPGQVLIRANQDCIGLIEREAWAGYEGKQVTLPVEPTRGFWQSDASVPWGALRVDYVPGDVL